MKKGNLKIDIFFYAFLNIALLVLLNDYLTYFINTNYLVTIAVSGLALIGVNYFLIKKKKIELTKDIEKTDIFFFVLLLVLMAITIPYADRSFDTYNYHLYLQEHPFGDKLYFDLFAGKNLNTFTYAFADRLFYLFRYFLGYRLGTILNYFLLIVMYYQVKRIFKRFIEKKNNPLLIVFFTACTVFGLSLLDIADSYYIDLITIPLLLEAVEIALFSDQLQSKEEKNNWLFGYLGLLFGLSFAVKISNAFLVILIFVIYVIKHKNLFKCLTFKNVLITILCFLAPFILYMVYTYLATGNPVFPFYNTIFHSEYFANANWLDTRFGPHGNKELLIWPILAVLDPGRCVDQAIIEPIWAYGYVVAICYIIYYFIRRLKDKNYHLPKNKLSFFIAVVLFYLVWSKFILGYSRYGLVVLVLGSITTFILFYDVYRKKKYFLLAALVPFLIYNFAYSMSNFMFLEKDWIFNNYYNSPYDYTYNIKKIFSSGNNPVALEENSVWAVAYNNAGLLQSLNNQIPMINLNELSYIGSTSELRNDYTIEMIQNRLSQYDKIYTAVDSLDYDLVIKNLNDYGYEIVAIKDVITSDMANDKRFFVYVFEIALKKDAQNERWTFNGSYFIDDEQCSDEHISMFVSIANTTNNNYYFDFKVSLYGYVGDKATKLTETPVTRDGKVSKIDISLKDVKYDKIEIRPEYNDGTSDNSLWLTVLNYKSVCEQVKE